MLFKVTIILLYMASERRLAVYQRMLEDSGLTLIQNPSDSQLVDLHEKMFDYLRNHPEQKKEFRRISTLKGKSNLMCLQVSRMLGVLYHTTSL